MVEAERTMRLCWCFFICIGIALWAIAVLVFLLAPFADQELTSPIDDTGAAFPLVVIFVLILLGLLFVLGGLIAPLVRGLLHKQKR